MSADHDRYRDGVLWLPFYAEGDVQSGGGATTLSVPDNFDPAPRQPIGFRGAAPGESLDRRGLPRVRVKAPAG